MVIRSQLFFILHVLLTALAWPGRPHIVNAVETRGENAAALVELKSPAVQQRHQLLDTGTGVPFFPNCDTRLGCLFYPSIPTCCPTSFFGYLTGGPGSCVNLINDPRYCGNCSTDCTRQNTFSCCFGKCVNISSDMNNCGGCGIKCPSGGLYSCCVGRCVNILVDDNNCGGCGIKCNINNSTQCPTSPSTSPPPPPPQPLRLDNVLVKSNSCCLARCVDIFNDRSNCGGCGVDISPLPYICSRGKPVSI